MQIYICSMELVYSLDGIDEAAKKVLSAINKKQDAGKEKAVAVEGDMGAGKTTLILSICRQLGVTGTMGSPTFSIINEYSSGNGPVYHIDLYRCGSEEEAIRAGVEECLFSGNVCLVEWPSRAEALFPVNTIRLSIGQLEECKRKIIVNCKK